MGFFTEKELTAIGNIWHIFKQYGYSDAATAGVLGNLYAESNLEPNTNELSGGGGYGIGQWTPKSNLYAQAAACGISNSEAETIQGQAKIVAQGDKVGQWTVYGNTAYDVYVDNYQTLNDFKKTNHIATAVANFCAHWARPDVEYARMNVRLDAAERIYQVRGQVGSYGSIGAMIGWMEAYKGKVTYAMVRPWSTLQNDCSGAVIEALRAGGFMDDSGGNYGNTSTLQLNTMPKIAHQISRSECKRGDIFLANPTAPNGANAHTGIFLDNNRIIHCNAGAGTISITQANGYMGNTPHYFWRLNNAAEGNIIGNGEIEMKQLFEVDNKPGIVYYFNGEKIVQLKHVDEMKILQRIYRENNGKEMPYTKYYIKEPWHGRLDAVTKYGPAVF